MGILLKSDDEVEKIYRAGQILCEILDAVEAMVAPGVSTLDLDRKADELLALRGARGAFKGYQGFPGVLCTSINDQVVHGIPSESAVLKEGDLISIDCGVILDGYVADSARTVPVGEVSGDAEVLLQVTREALFEGIGQCKAGARLGNIGAAIQRAVEPRGMSLVREYSGHGVGRSLHEDPTVPNRDRAGHGPKMRPGLVIAIEPMVNLGHYDCRTLDDAWTVVTADGSLSAHFEHTVAITPKGPRVLTQRS